MVVTLTGTPARGIDRQREAVTAGRRHVDRMDVVRLHLVVVAKPGVWSERRADRPDRIVQHLDPAIVRDGRRRAGGRAAFSDVEGHVAVEALRLPLDGGQGEGEVRRTHLPEPHPAVGEIECPREVGDPPHAGSALGVTFCPMFGSSPDPSITSVWTPRIRSLPPSAAAASFSSFVSGGVRAQALAITKAASTSPLSCFIIGTRNLRRPASMEARPGPVKAALIESKPFLQGAVT